MDISIAIRETGTTEPIGGNGGSSGGIEWVNLDGQTLVADGTWQQFTFTPSTDTLTAFAGATADGLLSTDRGTLEHIRFKSRGDNNQPWTVYIDDILHFTSGGEVPVGFEAGEGVSVGNEVLFQEPRFSGSTSGNLAGSPNSSAVTDTVARTGSQSYQVDFQFVDDDPSRWVRLTTFNAAILPNPTIVFNEAGFAPTLSFWAMAVPEPSSIVLLVMGGVIGAVALRKRMR